MVSNTFSTEICWLLQLSILAVIQVFYHCLYPLFLSHDVSSPTVATSSSLQHHFRCSTFWRLIYLRQISQSPHFSFSFYHFLFILLLLLYMFVFRLHTPFSFKPKNISYSPFISHTLNIFSIALFKIHISHSQKVE